MEKDIIVLEEEIKESYKPKLVRYVKLHSKYGKAVWLLSELDAANNIAFGLCDLGQGKPELSYVSITDLESIKHARLKVPMVEIDPVFDGKYPLSVYLEAAKINKRVTEDEASLEEAAKKSKV